MAGGELIGGPFALDSDFDITAAICRERRMVRVTFSEQPKALFNQWADDALNVANWAITPRPDLPLNEENPSHTTVVVTLVEIVHGDPLSLDVSVDVDFSFDVQYEVEIAARVVTLDGIGGWINQGIRNLGFYPYDPACRTKPTQSVFSWFGKAARKFDTTGDAENFISIIQDMLEQMKSLIDCFPNQFDPLYCNEEFLDSRLRSLGNPFDAFTSDMTLIEKRRVALQLIDIYRLKGTTTGIKSACEKILGISPIEVMSWNENTWRIGESFAQLGIPFDGVLPNGTATTPFLGGGLFVPTGGPPTYPTTPIDPDVPSSFEFTGTMFLGSKPVYTQAYLGGSKTDDTKHIARIGQWNLAPSGNVPYTLDPAYQYVLNPSAETDADIGVDEEQGRRAIYAYRITLPVGTAPTTDNVKRIQAVAKYMQPSNMHLVSIKGQDSSYDPLELGISWLGVDWILH